jgi:hypothetical protein
MVLHVAGKLFPQWHHAKKCHQSPQVLYERTDNFVSHQGAPRTEQPHAKYDSAAKRDGTQLLKAASMRLEVTD